MSDVNTAHGNGRKSDYKLEIDGKFDELKWFHNEGALPRDLVVGKSILDWECGNCTYAAALMRYGAGEIVAIDTYFHDSWIPEESLAEAPVYGRKMDVRTFSQQSERLEKFDLVFSNTVTEHIQDLPSAFDDIYKLLKPGGYFFTNHGNYYDPVGSHDHGFMFYKDGGVRFLGPKCWESSDKCATSTEFREKLRKNYAWIVEEDFNDRLTPENCSDCPFFKRAQPWAHLLYQSEFRTLFRKPGFTTGRLESSLNKMTSFQVRQLLIEAGFRVVKEHRSLLDNDPPPELLVEPFNFSAIELRTGAHRFLARKPEMRTELRVATHAQMSHQLT